MSIKKIFKSDMLNLVEEITYNFYHVEQHGRSNLRDPWSIRQTAVYQKFSFKNENSTWIIVQLAKPIRNNIEKVIAGDGPPSSTTRGHWLLPIVIHTMIMTMSQRNWKTYIQYLAKRLATLVSQRPPFSRAFPVHTCHSNSLPTSNSSMKSHASRKSVTDQLQITPSTSATAKPWSSSKKKSDAASP